MVASVILIQMMYLIKISLDIFSAINYINIIEKKNNMKFRWTIKELKERSDDFILRGLVSERMSELNPYAPLNKRLQQIYNILDDKIKKEQNDARH